MLYIVIIAVVTWNIIHFFRLSTPQILTGCLNLSKYLLFLNTYYFYIISAIENIFLLASPPFLKEKSCNSFVKVLWKV